MFARKAKVSVMIVKVNGITEGYLVEQKTTCMHRVRQDAQDRLLDTKNATLKMCVIAQTVELVT